MTSPAGDVGDAKGSDRGTGGRDAGPSLERALAIGGPTTSSWREHALSTIAEIRSLSRWLRDGSADGAIPAEVAEDIVRTIIQHLDAAADAAADSADRTRWERLKAWASGSQIERTNTHIDAAQADLLRLAPSWFLRGQMPSLIAHVRNHLAPDDPRRVRMERISRRLEQHDPDSIERDAIVGSVRAASSEARREVVRLRSFRNVLLVAALVLTVATGGVLALGLTRPEIVPLCFTPDTTVACPTHHEVVETSTDPRADQGGGAAPATVPDQARVDREARDTADSWDVPLVLLFGFLGAALASTMSLREIWGTSTPYSLPIALAVLKLPSGALTAFLGLTLMRGEFVPGLSALDNSAQIVAWAAIFGYSQQVFTRFVDRRAQDVLNKVGGGSHPSTDANRGSAPSPAAG